MMLSMRPLSVRLRVAYMATAYRAAIGKPFTASSTGNTLDRLLADNHEYSQMWDAVASFYKSQGFHKLCDAELHDRFNAAMSVGFTTSNGQRIPAATVHSAAKLWEQRGWFRYEHKHAGRVRLAKRVSMIGFVVIGVPIVSDL